LENGAAFYVIYMRIPKLSDLPDLAQRAEWARRLQCDHTTLYRAEMRGDLKGYRGRNGAAIYSKKQILDWLGLTEDMK
jgi:hypothetical protein